MLEETTGGFGKQGRPARKQHFKRVEMMGILEAVKEKGEQILKLIVDLEMVQPADGLDAGMCKTLM